MAARFSSGRQATGLRKRRFSRRAGVGVEVLEDRWAMAQLSNGTGDGQLTVFVNEQGAFGSHGNFGGATVVSPSPFSTITPNIVGDAFYNDFGDGRLVASGTTYESGVAIGFLNSQGVNGAPREFLTAGLIGTTGNNLSGVFLNPPAQPALSLQSEFFYPNTVTRNANDLTQIIGVPTLRFNLVQTLQPLLSGGIQTGTALVQTYSITNVSNGVVSFDLVRYADFDVYHGTTAADLVTPFIDGAGKRTVDPRGQLESVFVQDVSKDDFARDPSLIQVYTDGVGVAPLPRPDRWEVNLAPPLTINNVVLPDKSHLDTTAHLRGRIILAQQMVATQGTSLADAILPATADPNGNLVTDTGQDMDWAVALRNVFENVQPNETVVYTVTTQYGDPPLVGGGGGGTSNNGQRYEGHVTGTVFADYDGDGFLDAGEPGMAGVVMYADLNNNGVRDGNEPTGTSNADGIYDVCVRPGTDFVIRQVPVASFTPTSNAFITDVGLREVVTDINFGNRPDPSSISGVVFNDLNANGVRETGENGLAGFRVFVDYNSDSLLSAGEPFTDSAANGSYTLSSVRFGSQRVLIVSQAGFQQTLPPPSTAHIANLAAGENETGFDFGLRALDFTISGTKFHDGNGNGTREGTEVGLAGFIIYVDLNGDGEIGSGEPASTSAADGSYSIRLPIQYNAGVPVVQYTLREAAPAGWALTTPAASLVISNVTPGGSRTGVLVGNRAAFDFGDAPAPFPTLAANNGARHAIHPSYFLGSTIAAEADGNPTAGANAHGDDDGVTLPALITGGQAAALSVRASRNGFIQAWIDFNGDGNWNGPGEQVLTDAIPVPGQLTSFTIQVPTIINSGSRAVRVRYAPQRGLGFTGLALGGEVEDYVVNVGAGVQAVLPPEPLDAPGGEGEDRALLAYDISSDGRLSNVDLFVMLNDMRRGGAVDYWSQIGSENPRAYYDISGDGRFTNLDLIQMVSQLRGISTALGEGEGLNAALPLARQALASASLAPPLVVATAPSAENSFAGEVSVGESSSLARPAVTSQALLLAPAWSGVAAGQSAAAPLAEAWQAPAVAEAAEDFDELLDLISADIGREWNDQ